MDEYELSAGESLVIPGVGTLTLKDIEGDAALLGLDLEDETAEERMAAEEER
jgi:hypothetical protein